MTDPTPGDSSDDTAIASRRRGAPEDDTVLGERRRAGTDAGAPASVPHRTREATSPDTAALRTSIRADAPRPVMATHHRAPGIPHPSPSASGVDVQRALTRRARRRLASVLVASGAIVGVALGLLALLQR